MRRHRPLWRYTLGVGAGLALSLGSASPASAEAAPSVSVTAQRVTLRDVLPDCPAPACDADLGSAAPAGSSRLIAAAVIRSALAAAGADVGLYPASEGVQVASSAQAFSPRELAEWVRPSIERSLPEGVRLTGIEARSSALLPLAASAGTCTFSQLPKRPGPQSSTVLVDVLHEGNLVRRLSLVVRLVMSEQAARPAVRKGQSLTLVISRRTATISAQGVALRDAERGQIAPFKVQSTGRVVLARIESAELAAVVEGP